MLNSNQLTTIRGELEAVTALLRLPFRHVARNDRAGSWIGAGIGNSIDFQDHRPYFPGDDPRHINWRAYARSQQYTMKLYREEVSPKVDVALDTSESMFFDEHKMIRTIQLFYFCILSALQAGATVNSYLINNEKSHRLHDSFALDREWTNQVMTGQPNRPPDLKQIPWRHGSMRIFITDLLYPGSHREMLTSLTFGNGRATVFVPYCKREAYPQWRGNLDMVDCESRRVERRHVNADLIMRYRTAYDRHFSMWRGECERFRVVMARIVAGTDFIEAMRLEPLSLGAIELWT